MAWALSCTGAVSGDLNPPVCTAQRRLQARLRGGRLQALPLPTTEERGPLPQAGRPGRGLRRASARQPLRGDEPGERRLQPGVDKGLRQPRLQPLRSQDRDEVNEVNFQVTAARCHNQG